MDQADSRVRLAVHRSGFVIASLEVGPYQRRRSLRSRSMPLLTLNGEPLFAALFPCASLDRAGFRAHQEETAVVSNSPASAD